MTINFKDFQKSLAQHKVYDAWQYVESLKEILFYMNISYKLLEKVYADRLEALSNLEQKTIELAIQKGKASVKENDLYCTNLNIAGLEIDDTIFLRKNIIEFFHYARLSIDILFQIINAALFVDESIKVTDKELIKKVRKKLNGKPVFVTLYTILKNNKDDDTYKYLQAYDNHIKHIKTILVTVKNSFIFGNSNEFMIKEFTYNGKQYPTVKALDKVKQTNDYIIRTIEEILLEVQVQLPNCLDNSKRIQAIKFQQSINNSGITEYISFFIDVKNDLSELPQEIKVLPLIVKPNYEIYSFDLKYKIIFIRDSKKTIIGCAEFERGEETNELYRKYKVRKCNISEYNKYISSFSQYYTKISINYNAMEGLIIFSKD